MGRHSANAPSMMGGGGRSSKGPASADGPDRFVDVEVFPDTPPQRVNVAKMAPFGWNIAILLALVAFVDKAENSLVGGVLEELKNEWGFNDAVGGLLLSAPIIASVLLIIPAGILADTKRRKNILVVVLIVWSVFSLGSAAAPGLIVFFAFRIALGAAAPLNIPPTSSLIADYYPRRARSKAFSIVRSLESAGQAAGTLIGALVIWATAGNWRVAFVLMAIPGIILAFVVLRMLGEPLRGVGDKISGLAEGVDAAPPTAHVAAAVGAPKIKLTTRVKQVFASATVRKLVLGQAVVTAAFAGLFSFATSFFARFYFDDADTLTNPAGDEVTVIGGLTDQLAAAGWTNYVDSDAVGMAGLLVAGSSIPAIAIGAVIASKIDSTYSGKYPALRVVASAIAILSGTVALLGFCLSEPLAMRVGFFLIFAAIIIIAVSNLAAATADVIPARLRGSGFAVLQMCMAIGGAFGPLLIGIGSGAANDDLRWGFFLLIFPLLIGATVLWSARKSYPADALAVMAEGKAAPLH